MSTLASRRDAIEAVTAQIPHWMPSSVNATHGDDPEDGPLSDFTSPSSLKVFMADTLAGIHTLSPEEVFHRVGFVQGVLAVWKRQFDWPAEFAETIGRIQARAELDPPKPVYKHPDWYDGVCPHFAPDRTAGGYDGDVLPRMPLRYGSAEVEVCNACQAYRLNVHAPKVWWKGPYAVKYAQAVQDMEDMC